MICRLDDSGLALRLFMDEAAARGAAGDHVPVRYALGWIARTPEGWADAFGALPRGWHPDEAHLGDSAPPAANSEACVAAATPGARRNTPIQDLLQQYANENCDHTDLAWVSRTALMYAETMPDSQARCLLYVLARHVAEQAPAPQREGRN